ncbi:MAG: ATP-dependent DNA helicase RecG, partial [Ghiorsea sp.]
MMNSIYTAFTQPITDVDGIGPASAKKLQKSGLNSMGDLLFHLPKSWVDDQNITPIAQLTAKQSARIQGVVDSRRSHGFGRKATIHIRLSDDSGASIELSFFHASYLMSDARLQEGQSITARGTVEKWGNKWQMTHPEWSTIARFQAGYIPQYASIAGFNGKKIAIWLQKCFKRIPNTSQSPLDALLPDQPSLLQALSLLHQSRQHPPQSKPMQQARQRLQLEELIVYLSLMQQQRKLAEITTQPLDSSHAKQLE